MVWPIFPHFISSSVVQRWQGLFFSRSSFVPKRAEDLSKTDRACQSIGINAFQNLTSWLFSLSPRRFQASVVKPGSESLIQNTVSSHFATNSKKISGQALESELTEVFSKEAEFESVSKSAIALMEQAAPEESLRLKSFLEQNARYSTEVQEKGWNALKKEWAKGYRQEASDFDSFRRKLVTHVLACIKKTVEEMGYKDVCFTDVGTYGWNSDIDVNFDVPEGMKEEIATYSCEMFYMVMYGALGKHSGFALDTECYVGNANDVLNAEDVMGEGGYAEGFSRLESDAFHLQMLYQLGGVDSEGWRSYKSEFLENVPEESLQRAFESSFSSVEEYYRQIETPLQNLGNSSGAYPGSERLALRRGIYRELAPCLDKLKAAIKSTEDLEKRAHLQGLLTSLTLMRATFFDEGYLSKGSFLKIVAKFGGQAFENITVKGYQEKLTKHYREASRLQKMTGERAKKLSLLAGFSIPEGFQSKEVSMQDSLGCSMENEAMYEGHFKKKLGENTEDRFFRSALISTSKYALRSVEASLDLFQESDLDIPEVQECKARLERLQSVAAPCEQVKRDRVLNLAAGMQLLKKFLLPSAEKALATEVAKKLLQQSGEGIEDRETLIRNLSGGHLNADLESVIEESSEKPSIENLRKDAVREIKQQIAASLFEEFKQSLSSEEEKDSSALLFQLQLDSNPLREKTNAFFSKYRKLFSSEKEIKQFFTPLLKKEALQEMVNLFDSPKFKDESVLPQDRFLVAISKLVNLGLVELSDEELSGEGDALHDRMPSIKNNQVEAIVLALCGFDKGEYPQIQEVLDEASAITLGEIVFEVDGQKVDLTTRSGIGQFNSELRQSVRQACAFAYRVKKVASPVEELLLAGESYSLPSLLQKAQRLELSSWIDSLVV